MPFPTNQQVIEEFRANGGQVGGPFAGAPLILLTTTGARTGLPRTSPTTYARDGERLYVFASNAGGPQHPAWLHNLRAQPRVVVEIGRDGAVARYAAVATEVTGGERDRIYARQAELVPAFAAYQAGTSRVIPVVALDPVAAADDPAGRNARLTGPGRETRGDERVTGGGAQLQAIHDGLRADLAELRARLADGRADAQLPPSVLEHCLAFCGAVSAHHDRESSAFPDLERRFPELAPALERIRAEHGVVAGLVTQLRDLLAGEHDRATLRTRVDGLAAELEAHFAYEEAQLVPALDAARPGSVGAMDVTNNGDRRRYEVRIDGELAGIADYIPTDELVAFTHTEVMTGFEGRGVGSALVRAALDDVRAQRRSVLAVCPFVSSFVQRHGDEYGDLLYRSRTGTVGD